MRKILKPRFGAEQKENMKMLCFKCRKIGYKPKKIFVQVVCSVRAVKKTQLTWQQNF
jgi:hypothetical protein